MLTKWKKIYLKYLPSKITTLVRLLGMSKECLGFWGNPHIDPFFDILEWTESHLLQMFFLINFDEVKIIAVYALNKCHVLRWQLTHTTHDHVCCQFRKHSDSTIKTSTEKGRNHICTPNNLSIGVGNHFIHLNSLHSWVLYCNLSLTFSGI